MCRGGSITLLFFIQSMHNSSVNKWQCVTGMILRSTIVKLLQHRLGFYVDDANGHLPPPKSHIPTTQKVTSHTCRRCSITVRAAVRCPVFTSFVIFALAVQRLT